MKCREYKNSILLQDTTEYTYNAANRMDTVTLNGALQAEYVYNYLGQQVIRRLIPSGQVIHSIFDLDGNRIAEYDYSGGTSTLIREYIWMGSVPVGVIEGGVTYQIKTDYIGRPVFANEAINVTGAKEWKATYLPFGGVDVTDPPLADIPNTRFPGQWFQMESDLYQNWMRDYDPTTGRYMQADPLGLVAGPSIYNYALQNPTRYTDPRGECPWCLGAAIGSGTNFVLQFATNWVKYGNPLTAVRCVDIKDVVFSAGFGFLGGGLLGPVRTKRYGAAAGIWATTTYTKKSQMPITIGDECECDGGKSFGTEDDVILDLIGSSHL